MNNHEPNHTAEADRIRAELEDYLMDQNLEEMLGGVTPNPEDRTVAPAPVAVTEAEYASKTQPARAGHSWIKPVALLAACAGIGLVLIGGLFGPE
ncbi:MAG: hypothetical protein JJ992_17000, partial [Planctomycetes bacterium]|nr:hypothetical protein [Planctomycetota bacterium]